MKVNGWELYQHPLFKHQYEKLVSDVERIRKQNPTGSENHKKVKLLAKITNLISTEIPADPTHDKYNQGNTLGPAFRQWKRAKFGRYRLFFRCIRTTMPDGKELKVIVYAWVNDEDTLRKDGDKNDPYALFARGLARGEPPDSVDSLIEESAHLNVETTEEVTD